VDQKSRFETAALLLLAVGVVRHYGYTLAQPEDMGIVSKGLGGVALLATIPFAWKAYPGRLMALVLAWWAFEALQITLCSFAYWIKPWEVLPSQSICSARFGMDLGALGIMLAALILWRIVRVSNTKKAEKWQ
jgi:hypothetical protein